MINAMEKNKQERERWGVKKYVFLNKVVKEGLTAVNI